MRYGLSLIFAALTLPATVNAGFAATIDFDDGTGCSGADYTITQGSLEGECTFSFANFYSTPNGSDGLVAEGEADSFWTLRFSQLMSQVGIDLGDFGVDDDWLFLAAYDESNTLIGTQTALLPGMYGGMQNLALDFGSNVISWVAFGTNSDLGGVYADYLSYDRVEVAPVPVPAAGGMLLGGLGLLGLLRRRKKR